MWLSVTAAAFALRGPFYLLPGVGGLEDFAGLLAGGLGFAGFTFASACVMALAFTRAPRAAAGLVRRAAGFEFVALGVRREGVRAVLVLVVAGAGGAIVTWGTGGLLASSFTWHVPPSDPRDLTGAPVWSALLFGLLAAPVPEEVLFRGPLLILAAALDRYRGTVLSKTTVTVLQLLGLVVSAGLFGWWHLNYSVFNAVAIAVAALVWGGLALWGRSLLPALVAHGLYDAAVFGLQATGSS